MLVGIREYFLTCRSIALILQEKNDSDVLTVREKSKAKQTNTLLTLEGRVQLSHSCMFMK